MLARTRRLLRPTVLLLTISIAAVSAFPQDGEGEPEPPVDPPGPCVNLVAYDSLTNSYRSATNFNVETTRGMATTTSGLLLFINTHGSTLNLHIPGGQTAPDFVWPTVNNPVSLDFWLDGSTDPATEMGVVLGAGTHALALHSLSTGRIVDLIQFDAEPGDLVIDRDSNVAFVSLPGKNAVAEIDMLTFTVTREFSVASERPRFLSLEGDGTVLVTPELSTNNTLADGYILKLADPTNNAISAPYSRARDVSDQAGGGLPDSDLFRIDPSVSGATPVAAPVLRGAGTLLMAHGRNPVTGEYWIVGTDSMNTTPGDADGFPGDLRYDVGPTEPKLKGNFARNTLTIAGTLGAGTTGFGADPTTIIDLDLVGAFNGGSGLCSMTTAYAASHACSMPYGLEFSASGVGVIAASASDRLRVLTSSGCRVGDLQLAEGTIPRDIMFSSDEALFFVYCWGTNEVLVYNTGVVINAFASATNQVVPSATGFIVALDLGADPYSGEVKRGREIFYDGGNSENGRMTCTHCHPGGGMDLLGWNIADFPHDHKDLMVTQSLKSIEDTFPYHWRGERDLEAFNGAFSGLLGGTNLVEDTTDPDVIAAGLSNDTDGIDRNEPSEFEDFKAFIFSLQVHANPRQHNCRRLDAGVFTQPAELSAAFNWPGTANAVNGQAIMDTPDTLLARFSCTDCHGKNTGTIGDTQQDDLLGSVAGNRSLDIAHFRELRHKTQPLVPITLTGLGVTVSGSVARNGFGLSHDGNDPSVFDFLTVGFDFPTGGMNPSAAQQMADLDAFVAQADHGIAPSAHLAYRVDSATSAGTYAEIEAFLIDQEGTLLQGNHWVSIAILGTFDDGPSALRDIRLYGAHTTNHTFLANDLGFMFANGQVGTLTWSQLKTEAQLGRAEFTIVGLPPGNAYRFAADRDNDVLPDLLEASLGADIGNRDSDGDGDLDGHEWLNGGDPSNPVVLSSDSTAPTLFTSRVDHTGASYAKIALRSSEPCIAEITATDSVSGHTVVERRFAHRTIDTVTVQRLNPSVPSITIGPLTSTSTAIAQTSASYSFSIRVIDLAGNASAPTVLSAATKDHTMLNPVGLSTPTPPSGDVFAPPLITRIVDSIAFTPSSPTSSGGGQRFQANASIDTRIDSTLIDPFYARGSTAPTGVLDDQVIVAQVLRYDATNEEWTALDMTLGSFTLSGPTNRVLNDIQFEGTPVGALNGTLLSDVTATFPFVLAPAIVTVPERGDFVLSTTSGFNGNVSFDFTVTPSLPSGDRIKLNVVAILERDARVGSTGSPTNFFGPSINNWNKPATLASNRATVVQVP